MIVPVRDLIGRAAPIAVADMQDVVLEVLELVVGRLRSREVALGVLEKEPAPAFGLGMLQLIERVQGELVVSPVRVRGVDDAEKQAHEASRGRARTRPGA